MWEISIFGNAAVSLIVCWELRSGKKGKGFDYYNRIGIIGRGHGSSFLVLIIALTVVLPVSGEDTGTITIDQLLRTEIPGPISLSPEGNYLVYLKSDGAELVPEFANNTLMLIDLGTGEEHSLSDD